jgi:hypothetical protein
MFGNLYFLFLNEYIFVAMRIAIGAYGHITRSRRLKVVEWSGEQSGIALFQAGGSWTR